MLNWILGGFIGICDGPGLVHQTPPLALSFRQTYCVISHSATYRTVLAWYPIKTSSKELRDTIAASIARYESITAGPLSLRVCKTDAPKTQKQCPLVVTEGGHPAARESVPRSLMFWEAQSTQPANYCVENPRPATEQESTRNATIPPNTKNVRFPEIPVHIPSRIPQKYENCMFGVFFGHFRGIFSISWRRENSDLGLVFLAYFGVCRVFCSVAGSWVVNYCGHLPSPKPLPVAIPNATVIEVGSLTKAKQWSCSLRCSLPLRLTFLGCSLLDWCWGMRLIAVKARRA